MFADDNCAPVWNTCKEYLINSMQLKLEWITPKLTHNKQTSITKSNVKIQNRNNASQILQWWAWGWVWDLNGNSCLIIINFDSRNYKSYFRDLRKFKIGHNLTTNRFTAINNTLNYDWPPLYHINSNVKNYFWQNKSLLKTVKMMFNSKLIV